MMYAYAALALVIFGAGFGLARDIDKGEITQLKAAIERGNVEAEMTLQVAKSKVEQASIEANHANQQLETSHAQTIDTINALHDRLRDSKPRYTNTVPACSSAGAIEAEATSADISDRIRDMAYRADQVAAYANACWQFVSTDCGIKP